MSYKVTINSKSYDLPARTLSVDDGITALSVLDKQYRDGEITRREAVERMHSFVESLLPGALPGVEEVDTNDLMKVCADIISAYDAPARKARTDASISEIRDLLNRPEIAKMIELAKMAQK